MILLTTAILAAYVLFVVWFCVSAGLILLGIAGLIAYFITRAVFRRKGKAKPRAVWFIIPTVVLVLGLISMAVMVLVCIVFSTAYAA